jgi:hypothetical protein
LCRLALSEKVMAEQQPYGHLMNGELMTNCTPTSHVFAWQAHTPGGSIDYAAPPELRCQCGAVEYWRMKNARPAGDNEDAE